MAWTYQRCDEHFATARNPESGKPVAWCVRLFYDRYARCFRFKHHATYTVSVYSDNTYEIDTGGWHTNTTKKYIGRYSPVGLTSWKPMPSAEAGLYVRYCGNQWHAFEDGDRFDEFGRPLEPRPYKAWRTVRERTKPFYVMRDRIRHYLLPRLLIDEWGVRIDAFTALPEPMSGWKTLEELERIDAWLDTDEAKANGHYIPSEWMKPLLVPRPQQAFDRRRWNGQAEYKKEQYDSIALLDSAFSAARETFYSKYHCRELQVVNQKGE